ncbi:MAG: dual specificity protein phosphatase family protein [Desulfobia sp.]
MNPGDLVRICSEAEASGVLSLQHDDCLAYWDIDYETMYRTGEAFGLRMERCPIRDFDVADMRRRLPDAVSLLADMIARDHQVYVHCTAGMGRAPLTVLGYLTLVEGYSPETAVRMIREGRPESIIAWEAFEGCREDLAAGNREAIEQRAYELYKTGTNHDSKDNWFQAQTEILHAVLTK